MHQLQLSTSTGATEIMVGEQLTSRLQLLEIDPVLMVDENVLAAHHPLFDTFKTISIPSGEAYKTLRTAEILYRELLLLEADRSTMMVGVGGGLATDVAGFIASTFLRGTNFGFISTTLLGQVDASIGGKNGVNLDGYKNMIGTIRQPSFVWCDLSLLGTLDKREYVSGIAEVIKYGLIRDLSFMDYLAEHMKDLLNQEIPVMEHVVGTSAGIKASVVEKDEQEVDLRKILNFGHTIGHAIERNKGILHGEAVSLGMLMAAKLSHLKGLLSSSELDRVEQLLRTAGLPVHMELNPEEIYQNIRKDKKKSGADLYFVFLNGLGNTSIRPVPLPDLKSMIYDLC